MIVHIIPKKIGGKNMVNFEKCEDDSKKNSKNNYASLLNVLDDAVKQAQNGKGRERHADGQPYEQQPIMWIEEYFRSYQLGQAIKKIHESQRLPLDAAVQELLGAINYIAAHIIYIKNENT